MPQNELVQEVARITGEDVAEIERRGFTLADPDEVIFDPEPDDLPPNIIDWDAFELQRNTAFFDQPVYPRRRAA